MRALVLLIACLVPSLALGQDLTNKYQSLYTSRDAGGLAQLWRVAKEKLRLWPFPH